MYQITISIAGEQFALAERSLPQGEKDSVMSLYSFVSIVDSIRPSSRGLSAVAPAAAAPRLRDPLSFRRKHAVGASC